MAKQRKPAAAASQPGPRKPINPAALTQAELAEILSRAGDRRVTPADVRAAVKAGAPVGPRGSIHLVHFTAWLAQQSGWLAQQSG